MQQADEQSLSPRHLAEALGVSESSIKRWADNGLMKISRTAGGHRRIMLSEAVRFVRTNAMAVVKPGLLGLSQSSTALQAVTSVIRDHLLAGEVGELSKTLQSYYLQGGSIAALADGPIREAFEHIGELWQHSSTGIMIEHRAVDCCLQALSALRNLIASPPPCAPTALGGSPPGDPYILPAMLAAMVLEDAGWHTVNLGPNTPWKTLSLAVTQLEPKLLWLTVSAPLATEQAHAGRELLHELEGSGLAISVGGRRVDSLSWPATGHSLEDFADYAHNLKQQLEEVQ